MALVRGEGMEGWGDGGAVSRSLNVVYLEGVKEGEGVLIESEVVKAGKRLGKFAFFFSGYFIGEMGCVVYFGILSLGTNFFCSSD